MKFSRQQRLECRFRAAVDAVRRPALFVHVAYPVLSVEAVDSMPERWAEDTYRVSLKLFGVLPMGQQAICVTMNETDDTFTLHDAGYSRLIKKWDHHITIRDGGMHTDYTDSLDIDAGILTPFIWLFAKLFFRHRQRRLAKLAAGGFDF